MKRLTFFLILVDIGFAASSQNVSTFFGYYNSYIQQDVDLTIKDKDYYDRLDEIARAQYSSDSSIIMRAAEYIVVDDYESARYYAEKVDRPEIEWITDLKHTIIVDSYVQEDNRSRANMSLYTANREVDPETYRKLEEMVNSKFDLEEFRKKQKKKNLITGVAVVGGSAVGVGLLILISAIIEGDI